MKNLPISFFVSVIIPVYNDCIRLDFCLNKLESQTYPKDKYEIIVVDNLSDDDLSSVAKKYPQVRFLKETLRGSYAARNKGVINAKGKILAFTDSDCLPTEKWIENGVNELLNNEDCGAVGGDIIFYFKNKLKPTAAELYDATNFLNQGNCINNANFCATANMFTFKTVFSQVGLFNPGLKSGGDYEWGNRVFSEGYRLIFSQTAVVYHPTRYRIKQVIKKVIRISIGQHEIYYKNKSTLTQLFDLISKNILPPYKHLINVPNKYHLTSPIKIIEVSIIILLVKYITFWKKFIWILNNRTEFES